MKKVLIFSFFCSLFLTVSFAQKVKPVNYGGSVNLIEVRGRGYDAVLVLRTLGYFAILSNLVSVRSVSPYSILQ